MRIHRTFPFFLFFFVNTVFAQSRSLHGKIITDGLNPWPEALFFYKDSILLGKSNVFGEFQLNPQIHTDTVIKLKIVAVGAEEKLITIPAGCSYLEIILLNAGTYDYYSHRKVDRERLKYFKTLPATHKKAYANGVFKSEKPCYSEEFLFNKKRLTEIRRNRKN